MFRVILQTNLTRCRDYSSACVGLDSLCAQVGRGTTPAELRLMKLSGPGPPATTSPTYDSQLSRDYAVTYHNVSTYEKTYGLLTSIQRREIGAQVNQFEDQFPLSVRLRLFIFNIYKEIYKSSNRNINLDFISIPFFSFFFFLIGIEES